MKKLLLLATVCLYTGLNGQNDRFFDKIDSLVKLQQYEQATRQLHQFIDDHPGRYFDHAKAYFLISRNDLNQGNIDAAMDNNAKSLELRERLMADNIAENFMQLGAIYIYQKDYDQALQYLESARELPLEDPQVQGQINSYLAMALQAQGKYEQAADYLNKSLKVLQIELGPQHPDVGNTYRQLGALYQAQNKEAEAASYFKKALFIHLLNQDTRLLQVLTHP